MKRHIFNAESHCFVFDEGIFGRAVKRIELFCNGRNPVFYTKAMHTAPVVHFPAMLYEYRLLNHFYSFLHFTDRLAYWNSPQGDRDATFQSPFIGEETVSNTSSVVYPLFLGPSCRRSLCFRPESDLLSRNSVPVSSPKSPTLLAIVDHASV